MPDPYVLIDLETTGANSVTERITEIAALRVEHGEIVDRLETLVNPQRPIPAFIQRIIGITDDMVADAPSFEAVADRLREILRDAVFVAHNARFDYGFIRNEFRRMEQDFCAPVLCTVKLSRALYPQHHRHGLDALIERHGFVCDARHRAMGDADVLWQFVHRIQETFTDASVERACRKAMKFPPRPPELPEGVLEGLPDAPGVYIFFGEADVPLYVNRCASLRARVMEHFAHIERKSKEGELARKVCKLDWVETAGELGAMLLESELIHANRPVHNRTPSDEAPFGLRVTPRRKGPPLINRVALENTDPLEWSDVFGAFRTKKESQAVLRELVRSYRLCPRRLGLEAHGKGACSAYREKQCAGVCAGRESPAAHDERFLGALGAVGVKPWPWPGAVVVEEQSVHTEQHVYHLFDQWCHLGTVDSRQALDALRAAPPLRRFNIDVWRLIQRWLAVPGHADKVRAA